MKIKYLAWIPMVGLAVEFYNCVYAEDPYLADLSHPHRWSISVLWQALSTALLIIFLLKP